ncbi:hypothetical protein ACFL6H_05210 [Candidatus Latescibacterota bacterium]
MEPEQKGYAKISVIVVDELGEPLEGIKIITYPKTKSIFTDENGHAFFEDIEAGQYQVVASRSDIPIFYKETILTKYREVEMIFVVATKVTINVLIKDVEGKPLTDTEISTSPKTSHEITDVNGYVTFKNVPIRKYTFIVKRNNAVAYVRNKTLSIKDGKIADVEIIIVNEKPYLNIITPENHDFHNIFDVRFVCEGVDFEDGELPEDALSWHSSIDGELGIGKDITIDRLSVGRHTISLTGFDSSNNISQRFINLNLYYFEDDSYFPIPPGGIWKYKHQNPIFTLVNTDGKEETWILNDLEVEMNSIDSRKSMMRYTIETENSRNYCKYIVTDYFKTDDFETDLDNIYVSKTVEKFKIWNDNTNEYNPKSQMDIEMEYSPRLILLKNHIDPLSVSSYESNITVDVTWLFDRVYNDTQNYTETVNFVNSVELTGIETVETDFGTYEAAVITVSQGETERKWWLAKGIGLVRLEYNTFDTPITALLYDSNILTFSEDVPLNKNISTDVFNNEGNHIRKTLQSPPNTPEKAREIIEILRELSPR